MNKIIGQISGAIAALGAISSLGVAADHAQTETSHAMPPPKLEHMAVWAQDLEKTSDFLTSALGWRRHPIEFGVDDDDKTFGGMKLAFIDANGMWLELVEPTTPGPGMDFLKEKGNGSLVELDFSVEDFDKNVALMKARGIDLIGMDGKPLQGDGLLREWVMIDGKRVRGDERLSYLPFDLARGTSIELFWEYPNGVVLLRDEMWKQQAARPASEKGLRLDHVVVLATDLEKTANVYTDILKLKRHTFTEGLRRDWLGVGDTSHAWIDGSGHGFWIELVAPASPKQAKAGALGKLGDGTILELNVETDDIDALYDRMKAKGITMTAGDSTPLPAGKKALTNAKSGDRYSYFPLKESQGMRIMVVQRGPRATSVFHQRDASFKR